MKKINTAYIALTLACTFFNTAKPELSETTKNYLWYTGYTCAALATVVVAKKIYNRYNILSDSQEIKAAKDLLGQTKNIIINTSLQYKKEFNILNESIDSQIDKLKTEIDRYNISIFAFLEFKTNIDSSIDELQQSIKKLGKKRNHLVECQERLTQIKPDGTTYFQDYNELCETIIEQRNTMLDLCGNLKRLRRIITGLDEYKKSLILKKLNRLELKVDILGMEDGFIKSLLSLFV